MLLRTYVPMPVLEGMQNIPFDSGVARSATVDDIQLRREDVIMGVTVVSASVAVMPSPGATPQFTKTITSVFSADGVITANGSELGEDGRPMGIAACRFDFSIAELTATVPRAFLMTVTDSMGRDTPYASGYLVPVVAVAPETPVDHVVISPTELLYVKVGSTAQMGAAAYDDTDAVLPGRVVTFSSSDDAIATVNGIGLVTAASEGDVVITAASGGKQAEASVAVIPDVLLLATFTDADETNVDGWAADTGQVGEVLSGAAEIQGNQCETFGTTVVRWEVGRADAIAELDLNGASAQQYLAFRIQDSLNYLAIGFDTSATGIIVWIVEAGVFTPGPGSVDLGTHVGRVGVRCEGDQVQMLWNGSTAGLPGPATITQFETETGWGILGVTGSAFDTLTVQALP